MKTGVISQKTIASDDIKDTKSIMGMSSKGMEMAQYFLRDKIYSNKVLAVVREYISNAYDEHKKYGITESVDIKLSSVNNQWVWSVRDYAMGLDDHAIRNIFGVYFESTKSNDNDSIGGFGIGGKAGFSYTDTFYVNSHHNGTKTCYICTLGAGTKGIPVGEIYEISKESTTEQGIEISLEVKSTDVYDFSNTTSDFVKNFTPDAKIKFENGYNSYDDGTEPLQPILTKEIGDYILNQYDNLRNVFGQTFLVRMGGVLYPHKTPTKITRKFANTIVVDVPIGKLSIPISRESIENTPLNDKVFAEIEKHLDQLEQEEISELTTPKFGNTITGHDSIGGAYNGPWFQYNYKAAFEKTSKYYYTTSRRYNNSSHIYSGTVSTSGSKHMVYLIPDIKNDTNWHKRLINALTIISGTNYNGYVSMRKSSYDAMMAELDTTIDISDCVFVDVKTLKLPKLEKQTVDVSSYQVFAEYGRKEYHTVDELDAIITSKYFGGKDVSDDWYLHVDNMDVIHRRTIGLVKEYGTRTSYFTANSIKMVEGLKELGWLTPACPEYKDMAKKFNDENQRLRTIVNAENRLREVYFGAKFNVKVVDHIKKNPVKINRFENIKDIILKEDSTRGRILTSLRDYNRKITRQDLRKILMMKD
jgi:hypothetical protein